jgi:REP element-mobilizing transposase RayT
LHHIIARGLDRKRIFQDNADRHNFINRLGKIVKETNTRCYAWALIPNHFHLLLKTGRAPIANVMLRLLTGYAVTYNRRHGRHGHLFQNRYKSILCQEDSYLMELVRYIHLNPLRANIVKSIVALDEYSFSGHSVILGNCNNQWQDVDSVLKLYADEVNVARRRYSSYVEKGIAIGKRHDLTGGGLVRSSGGWSSLKAMRRAKIYEKADERILGDGDFVEQVLEAAQERLNRKHALQAEGYDLDKVVEKVAGVLDIKPSEVLAPGKERSRVQARSLLCYWAARELRISMAELSRRLKISASAVTLSVKRGEKIVQKRGYNLI